MQRIDNPMAAEQAPEPYFKSRAARDSVGERDITPDDAAQYEADRNGECARLKCDTLQPTCLTCHDHGHIQRDALIVGGLRPCPDCGTGKGVQK